MHRIAIYVGENLLGDGFLKLPFVRAMRQAFPKSHITWIAGDKEISYSTVLKPCMGNLLDEIIAHARGRTDLGPFDIIIDTQKDIRTTKWLRRISHKIFISRAQGFFWSTYKPPLFQRWKKPLHLCDQMLQLGSLAAGKPLAKILEPLQLPDTYTKAVKDILPAGKTYIGIAPGCGQPNRSWPLDNFIQLAREQIARGRVPVFILGPQELSWHSFLKEVLPEAKFPLQDHPELLESPLYTIALSKYLQLGIANDSGTGHLFGAADIPVLSLFGPTKPFKSHPLTTKGLTLRAPEPKNMGSLSVDTVLEVVEELLL